MEREDLAEVRATEARMHATDLPPTLGAFIAERARTLGGQIAGRWFQDDRALTFSELHEQADRLASSLSSMGLRKGAHVAVMLPNVPETMVVWTAIGRVGAVMVPVNTAYTASELSFVLNDSDAQFFILDEEFVSLFRGMPDRPEMIEDVNVLVRGTGQLEALIETGAFPFVPPERVEASDLLNIQYTSGTTGFPKGCMLSHEYWMRIGWSLAFTRGGDDHGIRNVLVWQPFFYMDGMWQLLSAFFLDATCYVARRMSISSFFSWLQDFEINACTFPEPALKAHPPSGADAGIRLRYIYAFGWRPESKKRFEERFPECAARDAYGMTELGTATVTPMAAGARNYQRTCGLEAPDRRLKIVDEEGREVPRGERGELWVSGPGRLWGYYKRPAANREAFRADWFRTGDLFYQDEDGYYFIVGRIKDMVKRSGENIAAREVEAVLAEMDEITEAAIVPVPDEQRGEEVKAYIRLQEGIGPEDCPPDRIIAHCALQLARFKLPRFIAYVDDFPRTPSRKIAKQRMLAETADLKAGSYDRVDRIWH
ncbi:MAG: class I adenylate-forming enzyme family protein [Pseudomonadota bacterium]